jgi:hypothetical protein
MCTRVGNQRSHGVVTARVRTNVVQSLRHQRRDLHQSTYPIPLGRLELILLSPPTEGTRLACEAPSGLVAVVVGDVCRGKGSFSGHCYWQKVLSCLVPAHGISHSKMGSYQAVLTP